MNKCREFFTCCAGVNSFCRKSRPFEKVRRNICGYQRGRCVRDNDISPRAGFASKDIAYGRGVFWSRPSADGIDRRPRNSKIFWHYFEAPHLTVPDFRNQRLCGE